MADDDLLPIGSGDQKDSADFLSAAPSADDYRVDIVDATQRSAGQRPGPVAASAAHNPVEAARARVDDDDSLIPSGFPGSSLSALADATAREHSLTESLAAPVDDYKAPDALENADLLNPSANGAAPRQTEHGTSTLNVQDYTVPHQDQAPSVAGMHIDELLRKCQYLGGSDLHVTAGLPPMVRKDGKVVPLPFRPLTDVDTQRLVYDILTTDQIRKFELTRELDFSYGVRGLGRYRFNVYRQRGSVGAAMRVIPQSVPSFEELRLPPIMRDLARRNSGLVLVTGPTGSGKSTTIASIIDMINSERACHIMTIEDPIEYLHRHRAAMVNQRELGTDTDSFGNALRAVLREDPDVILIGEMRDLETIAAAITLAETGHLVFATLHTRSAASTVDRIVDVFPAHQQQQVRMQLSGSLEAIVSQQLLPRLGGGRVAAIEIMIATSAIRNLIREGKSHQVLSVIETSQQVGMQAMDRVLADMHRQNIISYDEAVTHANDRENFQHLLKGY
ncbi:MAG: type IV pilus twitching motility protein PilT [Capsulimonadaceae bacterium]|nr:type IV pilus twitching motility protein PilT [Capsulimonadaceae bacterium]